MKSNNKTIPRLLRLFQYLLDRLLCNCCREEKDGVWIKGTFEEGGGPTATSAVIASTSVTSTTLQGWVNYFNMEEVLAKTTADDDQITIGWWHNETTPLKTATKPFNGNTCAIMHVHPHLDAS